MHDHYTWDQLNTVDVYVNIIFHPLTPISHISYPSPTLPSPTNPTKS